MSISLQDIRSRLGRSSGPVSISDAFAVDPSIPNYGSISLNDLKTLSSLQPLRQLWDPDNSPSSLYSLRLVNSSYSGPVITIRRSSDLSQLDFYADINGNLRSLSGIPFQSWIGSNTAHIVTWFDQSGNNRHASALTDLGWTYPKLVLDPSGSRKYVVLFNNRMDTVIHLSPFKYYPAFNFNGGSTPTFDTTNGFVNFTPGAVTASSSTCQFLNFASQSFDPASTGFSASCRFRFTGSVLGFHERIFDFGTSSDQSRNFILSRYQSSNKLFFSFAGTYIISDSSFSQNVDYNIAVVYDPNITTNGSCFLYVDGQLDSSLSFTSKPSSNSFSNTFIGKSHWGSDGAFNGRIYSLKVYKRILTPSEISDDEEYTSFGQAFSVNSQNVMSTLISFYSLPRFFPDIDNIHTFLGSSGDYSHRLVNSQLLADSDFFLNVTSPRCNLNGTITSSSPFATITHGQWNLLETTRPTGNTPFPVLFIGALDRTIPTNNINAVVYRRAFYGYMSEVFLFSSPIRGISNLAYQFVPDFLTTFKRSYIPLWHYGLVGRYLPDNFSSSRWTDSSDYNNHVFTINGNITRSTQPSINNLPLLAGDTSANMIFPSSILPSSYTLFHLTRYNGTNRGRIFTTLDLPSSPNNWLSGFHAGRSGVAHHQAWITEVKNIHDNAWVLSTDQNSIYRSLGVSRSNASPGSPSFGAPITINGNYYNTNAELSDWAVACILVFNRNLSLVEYSAIEDYLASKYLLPIPIFDGLSLFLDANEYMAQTSPSTTWLDRSPNNYHFTLSDASFYNTANGIPFMNIATAGKSATRSPLIPIANYVTFIAFASLNSVNTAGRALLAGGSTIHAFINAGTNSLGVLYNNTFIPCSTKVDVSNLSSQLSTHFNMWVVQLSTVSPFVSFFFNPSSLPLTPLGTITDSITTLSTGFGSIGSASGSYNWGNFTTTLLYHRKLAASELVDIYNRYKHRLSLSPAITPLFSVPIVSKSYAVNVPVEFTVSSATGNIFSASSAQAVCNIAGTYKWTHNLGTTNNLYLYVNNNTIGYLPRSYTFQVGDVVKIVAVLGGSINNAFLSVFI